MTDHATWVSFPTEDLGNLRAYLEDAKQLTEEQAAKLLALIEQYEAPGSKDPAFRAGAAEQNWVRDGECEIDDHAVVSASDEGAYVMAWVWCPNADAGIEDECELEVSA